MDESFFTYRPAIWNPPQGNCCETRQTGVAAVSPPTRNARPLQGGPGIFACGCQGGITHYTLPPRGAARRAPGDTPGPRFAASAALETGLDRPAACAPLPLFLPPFTRVGGVPPPGRQKRACGRTEDEGRGLLQRRKQRLRFLADAVKIHLYGLSKQRLASDFPFVVIREMFLQPLTLIFDCRLDF